MEQQIKLLPFLRKVMDRTTTHYREDFQKSALCLKEAVFKTAPEEKRFFWMARPVGTWIVKERNVFLRETDDYKIWTYYADKSKDIQAYRVTVTGGQRHGRLGMEPLGTVQKLDYPEQVKRVMSNALPAVRIVFFYSAGQAHEVAMEKYLDEREWLFTEYGMPKRTLYCPEKEEELQAVLRTERTLITRQSPIKTEKPSSRIKSGRKSQSPDR